MPQTPASQSLSPAAKKKLSRTKLISLVVVLVILWLLAVQILAADRYAAVVNVIEGSNQIGINPLADRLDFGDLSRDNGASRFVTLSNPGKCILCLKKGEKYVMIWKFGEIADLIKIDRNNFTLKPGEEVRVEFNLYIPVSAAYKQYRGSVWIFKWPKLF